MVIVGLMEGEIDELDVGIKTGVEVVTVKV